MFCISIDHTRNDESTKKLEMWKKNFYLEEFALDIFVENYFRLESKQWYSPNGILTRKYEKFERSLLEATKFFKGSNYTISEHFLNSQE